MGTLYALFAAVSFGAADYMGGAFSRRHSLYTVALSGQAWGLVATFAFLPLLWVGAPDSAALAWGALSGAGLAAGVLLMYRGMVVGRIGIVGVVTAVTGASLPVVFGLVTGERPTPWGLIGVALALCAIGLMAYAEDGEPSADPVERLVPEPPQPLPRRSFLIGSGFPEALGAGSGFALLFIALGQAGTGGGVWPLIASKAVAVVLLAIVPYLRRQQVAVRYGGRGQFVWLGVIGAAAPLAYWIALSQDLLVFVVAITSLYPAVTVLLARILLNERLASLQRVGIVLAVAGLTLITWGG